MPLLLIEQKLESNFFNKELYQIHMDNVRNVNFTPLKLDGWLRNRLRYCIWHHWKKPEKKRRSLIRLGVPHGQAYAWSRTRMGGWAVAQSPILGTTITIKSLKKRGHIPTEELFNSISPNYNNSLFPVI